jgi:hypothetical protein
MESVRWTTFTAPIHHLGMPCIAQGMRMYAGAQIGGVGKPIFGFMAHDVPMVHSNHRNHLNR